MWCIYADSKIRRGELWEARDMVEYLRNQVIVRLIAFSESLAFEGNRRIENKFSIESASGLLSTLQKVHSPDAYAKALMRIADLYVELLDKLVRKTRVKVSRKAQRGLEKDFAGASNLTLSLNRLPGAPGDESLDFLRLKSDVMTIVEVTPDPNGFGKPDIFTAKRLRSR